MKYLIQFSIIALITLLAQLLYVFLPLPIPASVYGLLLMLTALMTGVIKVSHVKDAGKFLIDIMPFMFIPAGVGLINAWEQLQDIWLPMILITIITTIMVMGVTGTITQLCIKKKRDDSHE